ncbi:MAG: leucyl/phenylalanyl-tRNA--protein transferase [Deltaproteobacteria bacterium]|nr:leucyl/phenylalanyl-tRNA--protein transferase [Deltaproteobacteria bacterium]
MAILHFPPIETASREGLLAIGGDLEVASLKLAYENGIFPWPTEEYPLLWFAPPRRAILEFKDLRVPKRMQRELKNKKFRFAIDRDFSSVIEACAEGRTRRSDGTWINPMMLDAYQRFHKAGHAHSFEVYNEAGQLAGGLYGVGLGKMFAGESMFFHESGASKAALIYAVEYLKSKGGRWMDIQMMTPLLRNLGAKEISRKVFMEKLGTAVKAPPLFDFPPARPHDHPSHSRD